MFQVPEARILKYSESNLEKLRGLKREHEVNARATKAAAAAAVVAATGASSDLTRPETLPHEALQPLFNDVLLYPSKSQVFEMVQCARECSNQVRISVSPLRTLRNANTKWGMA